MPTLIWIVCTAVLLSSFSLSRLLRRIDTWHLALSLSIIYIVMHLLLSITLCAINSIAYAIPQVAPITTSIARAATTASAPEKTESFDIVTVKYDVGSTTFVDVKTYTDYGSVPPSDLIDTRGSGIRTADLTTQTDPVSIVLRNFLPVSALT